MGTSNKVTGFDLKDSKRKLLAEKFIDLANYAATAIIFGAVVSKDFDSQVLLLGMLIYLLLLWIGFKLEP